MTATLLLAYVAILGALAWTRSIPIRSVIAQRLRAFFPSWRFFEDVEDVPTLLYRRASLGGLWGPWKPCLSRPRRRISAILLNPEGNLALAYGSLIQQLLVDLPEHPQDADAVEQSVPYAVVHALVVRTLHSEGLSPGTRYQFKITASPAGSGLESGEDVLLSPVYTAEVP